MRRKNKLSNANLALLTGLAALCGCGTAEVYPLKSDDLRYQSGLTYGSMIGVLNFNPLAEAGAKASVRRAAKKTCRTANVPSEQEIQLEGGPTGVSVGIGAMLSYAFRCPEHGAPIQ
jgi:hypothetical protein